MASPFSTNPFQTVRAVLQAHRLMMIFLAWFAPESRHSVYGPGADQAGGMFYGNNVTRGVPSLLASARNRRMYQACAFEPCRLDMMFPDHEY
jgi:hypothetical protein